VLPQTEIRIDSITLKALRQWLIFALLCLISLFAALWLRGGTEATPFAILESLLADIKTSVTECLISIPELIENLEDGEPKTHFDTQASAAPLPGHSTSISSIDHTAEDRQACNRPHTKSRSETDAATIYTWIDEKGQAHMSDTQPNGIIASVIDVGMKKRDFTYNIVSDGVSVPVDFAGQLSAGSKRI
jgi:hypothetical protein